MKSTVVIDNWIEENFNTKWSYVEFFYAYCEAKGIDYPEDDLTDEEYERMEKEFCNMMSIGKLRRLQDKYIEEVNKIIADFMYEEVNKNG